MSTISQNNIVVNYVVTSDQIAKTKTEFDKLTDAEKKAVDETKKLNDSLKKTGQEGSQSVKNVGKEMNNLTGIAKSGAGLLAGFFAISSIKEFTQKIFTTTAAFEGLRTTIDYATKGQAKSGEAFQYLTNLANTFGKDLQSLAGTYSSFTASSNLAGIKLNESNKIFEAAVKASAALGKSNQDTQGILLAFSQIVSKGTVQAEELRGQIGERIPGAFNLAAKAMGVTTKELNKMLEQGQVLSADFLPKFAVELEKAFGSAAQAKVNSLTASLGRFTTAFDKFLESPLIAKYLAETLNLISVSLDQIRRLTMTEGEKKAEQEAKIESNITNNLKTELAARLKAIQEKTNKNATMDQVVMQKYVETLAFQSKYETDVTNQKIITANSWNKVALTTAQNNLKNTNIVLAALEKEINGYTISNQKKKELTDAELKALEAAEKKRKKALEDEYNRKVELIELEKQIGEEKIKQTVKVDDQKIARMELEFATNLELIKVSKQYAALEVKQAKDKAKILPEIVKTQNLEITNEYIKAGIRDRIVRGKTEEETEKAIYAEKLKAIERNKFLNEIDINNEISSESVKNEKLILNEIAANEDIIKANEEAANAGVKSALDANEKILADNAELYRKLKLLRDKDLDDQKKKDAEKAAIIEATFDLAVQTTNGLFNLQSQYAARDMERKNKQFDQEIALADGNEQKIAEINERRAAAEREYRLKEFRANQAAAIANIIFTAAPQIIKNITNPVLAGLIAGGVLIQTGLVLAQPTPEFAEGTKGKPFKGRAIVGEKGTEKVVTQSGKVYYTPGVATLAQFDEPVQIIPNNQLGLNDRKQLSLIYGNTSRTNDSGGRIIEKLSNIESGLKNMPVAAISLDERGFMKKVRTPNRSTTILNNRFKN